MDRLTKEEWLFAKELALGSGNQREAYIRAFPNKRHWKTSSIDTAASELAKEDKIQSQIKEIRDELLGSEIDLMKDELKQRIYERDDIARTLIWVVKICRDDIKKNGVKHAPIQGIISASKELNAMDSNHISQQLRDEKITVETQVMRETGHMMKDAVLPVFINDIPLDDEDED